MRLIWVPALACLLVFASRASADDVLQHALVPDNGVVDAGAIAAINKARVTFETPVGYTGLAVWFDEARVPIAIMSTNAFTVEAGDHDVEARAMKDGKEFVYKLRFHLEPGDFGLVNLPLQEVPGKSACSTPAECGCLTASRTEEEVRDCVAAHAPPAESSCRACVISNGAPTPWGLVIIPLAAIARRRKRPRDRT